MHQSWTNRVLQCAVQIGILGTYCDATCFAQQIPVAEFPAMQKHGLPEVLSQQLFRDRQIELLLRSAESGRDLPNAELMRESLLPIFAHPHDVFELDSESQSATSVQDRALSLLMQSSPEIQRTWIDANRITAEQALESAILRVGRHEAARVAREFPLTEGGIRAQVIDLTCELLKGNSRKVAVQVRQLEAMYADTVLQAELQRQLRGLKQKLTSLNTNDTNDAASHDVMLAFSASASSGTIAPPWPQPLWIWRERIWNFPGAPQPETGYLLRAFDPEAKVRLGSFNNWRPVFWNDSIVIRTPFRIIALDRANGREQWSVPTDTFQPRLDGADDEVEDTARRTRNGLQSPLAAAAPIYGMPEFGLMASDSDFLYFVDRFAFFSDTDPYLDNSVGRLIRNRNGFPVIEEDDRMSRKSLASRLVALRRGSGAVPIVAWQIGDGHPFEYDPVVEVKSSESSSLLLVSSPDDNETDAIPIARDDSEAADQTWLGHRFLSPPTGQGTRLFVLTQNDIQIFLNCLQRNTGSLLWRQPLAYTDENAIAFADTSIFTKRTSTCVLSGETIVCSLADGMLIGVRAIDGTLQWATAIRDKASLTPEFRFGWRLPPDEIPISTPSILVPCISDRIVVCGNHASVSLYGLSLETGEILWKSSRRAFGVGEVGGSPDYYVAGISGSQVVLVGDRHCRSVDLQTGVQNWVVQIPVGSGRAGCHGDRCVIPMRSGQALTVNLSTGTLIPQSVAELPKNSMAQYGAVSSDDELFCVSTPTCVAVFPRVDVVLKSADQLPALAANPTNRLLIQAEAHLINGDIDTAMAALKEAVATRNSDTPPVPQLDELLAELILQQWGLAIGIGREALQKLPPGQSASSGVQTPPDAELLSQLTLPPEMALRASVFQLLAETLPDRRSNGFADLKQNRNWSKLIRLTNEWSIRPELLFDDSAIDLPNSTSRRAAGRKPSVSFDDPATDLPSSTLAVDMLSIHELRQLVSDTLQHPEMIPDDASRQRLANRLISCGEYAAAEVFLIRWCEASETADKTSFGKASDFLRQLRTLRDTNLYRSRPEQIDSSDENPGRVISNSESPETGITSNVSEPLAFELAPCTRQLDAEFEATHRQDWFEPLPKHCGMNTYLSSETDNSAKVISIDPLDGSVRDQLALPFPTDHTTGRFVPLSNGDFTPGMFPVCSTHEIAMISCPIPGEAGILWTRHFRKGEEDAHRVEFGSLGADHFIWHFAGELHCSDPMTGDDVWSRKRTLSQSDQAIMDRGSEPSVRRIAGDRHATIVMGSDSRSYERFNTRDGRLLGSGRLAIGDSESVVTVGRCLLYTDADFRLHLFDSASGKDELEDDEPILPLIRDRKTSSQMICQVLENNRVLVVSATLELIMIDVDHGQIIFRTPVSPYVTSGFVFSCSAFERHGRLFAALSAEGRSGYEIQRAYSRGAPQLSNGPLLCLDPVTGIVEWSTHVQQAVFPDVLGDPTDLLVSWSAPEASLESNMRYQSEDKLVVQVFDEATGQLIARSPVYSSLPPLRCVHLADERLMRLTTPNATISIRASAADALE